MKIDKNLSGMLSFSEKHARELVLVLESVVRLLGVSPESDDYYWVTEDVHGQVSYMSGCIGLWPLRDRLSKEEYDYLDRFFGLNNFFSERENTGERA